jgi:uncharacterized delta-60 repeat protein
VERLVPRLHRVRRLASAVVLVAAISSVAGSSAEAAPGDLDLSFGNGGKVTTEFGGNVRTVALQPDGKIVAGGGSGEWALARYNPNGSLDASFGNGGKVTTVFGVGQQAGVSDVTIQADVKIVGAGHLAVSQNSFDWALARYKLDGSLDSSFGEGGKLMTDFGGVNDQAHAIALQTDGKFVAAGRGGASDDFAVARYNPDGSLDASFGTGGKVTTSFGSAGEQALDVALQPDGKIVAVGSGDVDWGLARYNADGSLDATFGSGGKVTTDVPGGGAAFAVVLQNNGKIVVVGNAFVADGDFALARYNASGSLDAGFGNGGMVTTDFGGGEQGLDGVLQLDGKIVAAGFTIRGGSSFALARYEGDPVSRPTCQGRPATIVGTDGDDTLIGTPVDDVIVGLKGNDVIDGKGGKDFLCGAVGNDTLSGDLGDDSLIGATGNDNLDGGVGRDVLSGGPGTDMCRNGERVSKCEA